MTDITMIALSKLVPGRKNVRKTKPAMSIGELAASISAHGLLQNLVVAETENGRYSVEAGGRRLKALKKLAKAKTIPGNHPVPCRVVPIDDAGELSLAENIQREPMHPADEIEAFAQLSDAGHGPEAIAGRFGVTGAHVARRLKLARVSPRLIEALKTDEIDLDQLGALAFTDDHAQQERAFFDAPEWQRTPEQLRARVAQAHVAETDKLVRFVGLDVYQAEGGTIASDLFAEEDETRWLADRELLLRLAEGKLQSIVDEVRGEGWAWVEIAIDGVAWTQFPQRVREERRQLTGEEQAKQERLYARLDETEDETEIEEIEAAIDALAPSTWNADEVALAGAVIALTQSGEPKIERGLVRVDDVKALKAVRRTAAKHHDSATDEESVEQHPVAERPSIPAKLVDELLAHKTLALRVAITSKPDLALRVAAFTLAARIVGLNTVSCLDISVREENVARSIVRTESKAPNAIAAISRGLAERLPTDPLALWSFLAEADQETVLEIIAIAVAPGIDLRRNGPWAGMDARQVLCGELCELAGLDMTKWWSATVESYFEHIRKDVLIDALKEMKPSLDRSALEKASKKELLGRAKRTFKGVNWLPEPLRTSVTTTDVVEAIAAE